MDQFRCNQCFAKFDRSKTEFSLLQCGHLFCGKCKSQAGKQCLECGTENALSVSLNDPLPQNIAPYFTPMQEVLQKVVQTATFQENQLRITLRKYAKLESKYIAMKSIYWRLEHDMKNVMQKYVMLERSMQAQKSKLHYPEMECNKTNVAYRQGETPMSCTESISLHTATSSRLPKNLKYTHKPKVITSHQDSAHVDMRITPTGNRFLVPSSRTTRSSGYASEISGGILERTQLDPQFSKASRYHGSITKRN
ncbi:uncharacterized protein LOC107270134 [Cephus cinctus]|uniref:Uncharacterized protein LOC107270134 n=1 Tax=Cephus cinctus TaxID=211228 RepID=A0AAJ7C3N7_CEPCN|nr:uncharacterized protein LOC107270134 [Cephus cinctus]XP_015600336.1 uncharacterized protein LOC107270134 [Cephus cinctus]